MSDKKKQPLYDNNGARVCADNKIVRRYGQNDLIVMYDDFGQEIGREEVGVRDLYESPCEDFAIYGDQIRRSRIALAMHPDKNATREERQKFYELQKAAIGFKK